MPKTRKQKEETVAMLKEATKDAGSVVFVGFNKLKVADERVLRKSLREAGVSYAVSKKTLLKLVIDGLTDLPGQVALAWGADAIAPAKSIAEFGKKHEGMMSILGGIFEGKIVDASMMQSIATIPPRETLLSMLANVLSSPMRGLAIAVSEVAKKKQ